MLSTRASSPVAVPPSRRGSQLQVRESQNSHEDRTGSGGATRSHAPARPSPAHPWVGGRRQSPPYPAGVGCSPVSHPSMLGRVRPRPMRGEWCGVRWLGVSAHARHSRPPVDRGAGGKGLSGAAPVGRRARRRRRWLPAPCRWVGQPSARRGRAWPVLQRLGCPPRLTSGTCAVDPPAVLSGTGSGTQTRGGYVQSVQKKQKRDNQKSKRAATPRTCIYRPTELRGARSVSIPNTARTTAQTAATASPSRSARSGAFPRLHPTGR